MVVYVATEVAGSMKPRAGADKDATSEPLWTVVAVGSTSIQALHRSNCVSDTSGAAPTSTLTLSFDCLRSCSYEAESGDASYQ